MMNLMSDDYWGKSKKDIKKVIINESNSNSQEQEFK
jgi:hypothetical protein